MPDDSYEKQLHANYARNKVCAKQGPYMTTLSPQDEIAFRAWVAQNKVPFNPNTPVTDYDMRGYWKALLAKQAAGTSVNQYDKQPHYPDTFKTPYDQTFSRESIYATPKAPVWSGDGRYLKDSSGKVLFDATKDTGG